LNILPEPNRPSTVFVTIFNDDLQTYSLEVVRRLRSANIITEISFISGNLGKQLKTASAKEMSYAIIAGPDEAQQNVIVLRNLINGNEHKLEIDEAIKVIKSEAE